MKSNLSSSENPMENSLSYSPFDIPCLIEQEGLRITVKREGDSIRYSREYKAEAVEKMLLAKRGHLLFNPVEPVNKPKEITPFFLIQFQQSVTIKPRESYRVLVTFPVDIACLFMETGQSFAVMDIFSLSEQKYTLYGSPKSGLICRYWESGVYPSSPPSPDPLREGIMQISIRNTTPRWIEVTQAIFSANEMKIYYDPKTVYAETYMKILSETTAETGFNQVDQEKQLEQSLEIMASKKTIMTGAKQLMEEGI